MSIRRVYSRTIRYGVWTGALKISQDLNIAIEEFQIDSHEPGTELWVWEIRGQNTGVGNSQPAHKIPWKGHKKDE